jgi:hypothetical protein
MKFLQSCMIFFVALMTVSDLAAVVPSSRSGQIRFLLAQQTPTRYCIKAPCDQPVAYGYYRVENNSAQVGNKEYSDIVFQKIGNESATPKLNNQAGNYDNHVYLGIYESSTPCPPGQMCIALYQPTKFWVFGIPEVQEQAPLEQDPVVQEEIVHNVRMGSSSATWSPVVFAPAPKFSGAGLVGNYFASTGVATIHNPANAEHSKSYSFLEVVESSVKKRHTGKRYVGQLPSGIFLYGTLQVSE